MSFILLALACGKDGDKGSAGETGQVGDDTGGPDIDVEELTCTTDDICVDWNDADNDGVIDHADGENVSAVYLQGGCSLETAQWVLDTYGTGSGTIKLIGGDSDVYTGGLAVGSGKSVAIEVESANCATIIGLAESDPIITSCGNLTINCDGKLKIQGFATNSGIQCSAGSLDIDGVEFDNLTRAMDLGATLLTASDLRITQIQDIGIYLYDQTDASLTEVVLSNGLIGSTTQNAILAEDVAKFKADKLVVINQHTSDSVIKIDADYMLIIGLVALHNRSTEAIVEMTTGMEYESPSAQWCYFASSIIANNYYGSQGALVVNSEGDIVVHNVDVVYNYSDGAETVVDLSDPNNPYQGITTFTQCNVVGNSGLNSDGTPIKRSFVTQADIDAGYVTEDEIPIGDPTGYERVEYNNIYDNGEAVFEDDEGNNKKVDPEFGDVIMYNPDQVEAFEADAFRIANEDLLNGGNPNAQYPDYDGYPYPDGYDVPSGNTGGSITAFGGPVGDYLEEAVQLAQTEYDRITE